LYPSNISPPRGRVIRSRQLLVFLLAGAAACGPSHYYVRVPVPPRIDITHYGKVGLVDFTAENAKGQLNTLATRRFSEAILDAQRVEVLELGSADTMLHRLGEKEIGPTSAQAFGSSSDVPALFAGHLKVSNVKPTGQVLDSTCRAWRPR